MSDTTVSNTNNRNLVWLGHLASFGAYAIFGINIVLCKDIANEGGISPIALFTFRSLVAGALFWLLSFFLPKEPVEKGDMLKIVGASLIGLFIPQMTFLSAITMTTTIDTSILSSMTPIMTMFVAAIFLKEPITWKKALGVALGLSGALILIFNSVGRSGGVDHTEPLGVVLLIINTFCFALYLGIFRPLIAKYSVVTFMKWMFLVSFIVSLPLSAKQIFTVIDYQAVSAQVWWEIAYLIFFATFVAYFLIPLGQKHIRPTLVSMYSYLQPIIAAAISISLGLDTFTWQKLLAVILVFAGVAIVNQSRAATPPPLKQR
ncbi:MAG: DMT family transporter [Bacteroidales bacterium]|nr:DMT family transporter [Bacteroidales bacterium]